MHSFVKRCTNLASFYITTMILLGFCSWASENYERFYNGFPPSSLQYKLWLSKNSSPSFKISKNNIFQLDDLQVMNDLQINIKADFTPLFTWNVKQIFVYVSIIPQNENQTEIVLWDKIITKKEDCQLKTYRRRNKYPILDIDNSFENGEFRLVLKYNVMPLTGFLNYENRNDLVSKKYKVEN